MNMNKFINQQMKICATLGETAAKMSLIELISIRAGACQP
jgi:hypothetical protein